MAVSPHRTELDASQGRLPALVWRSPGATRAVLAVHGVMSHAGWFSGLGEALAERGITLAAVDRRGCGRAQGLAPGGARAWVDDLLAAARQLSGEGLELTLLGWCWGARTAVVAASEGRLPLCLMAPGLRMRPTVDQRLDAALDRVGQPLPLPFDVADFSEAEAVQAFIAKDPLKWRQLPWGFVEESRALNAQAQKLAPQLPARTLVVLAERDRMIDGAATRALFSGQRLDTVAGGHALILEQPGRAAELLAPAAGAPGNRLTSNR